MKKTRGQKSHATVPLRRLSRTVTTSSHDEEQLEGWVGHLRRL